MRVARRYRISGRVQGVGFRYFAESVERFERAIRHGPAGARVDHVDVEGTVPGGRDTGFAVT